MGLSRITPIAKSLGVTRQQVYTWWSRRAVNGFPESPEKDTRGRRLYDEEAVAKWFDNYRLKHIHDHPIKDLSL